MKELNIRKIAIDSKSLAPIDIPALFAKEHIVYEDIDQVNWPDQFPARPSASFGIAHTGDAILLHYKVGDLSVRAAGGNDRDPMWQDSCVEFFCAPGEEGDNRYYNIETNCIGRMYSCLGSSRSPREFIPTECYEGVRRWASIGNEPFDEILEPTHWELALVIPVTTYYQHELGSFDGKTLRGNFYKCGDKTSHVHFVSWSPIGLPNPDFHCPQWFGTLHFE